MAHYGEGRWTDISLQVQEVYNSSLVGQSLMEKAIVQVSFENDGCAVDALIEKLKNSEEKLTVELFARNRTDYMEAMKKKGVDAKTRFEKPREVDVKYRGAPAIVLCYSHEDIYKMKRESWLRGWAVVMGHLPTMWCENELVDVQLAKDKREVDEALLREAGPFRETLAEHLSPEEASAGNIAETLKKQGPYLLTIDPKARVELSFWMCNIGESCRARVQSKMLDCMGTVQTPMPLTVSCDKLELLSKSRLLVFSGAGLQSLMHSVLTFVLNLKDGIPPKLERAGDSPFIESVKGRLASYFSVLVPQAASSGAATTLYGEEAAKALYDTIAEAFSDDPEEVVSADIARLQCYHWLLTSDQLAELRKIATSTMARAGNAAATKARRSRRAAASTDSQAAVASLFQRR